MAQIVEFITNHPYLSGLALVLTVVLIANEIRMLTRKGLDISSAETVALINNGAAVVDLRSLELYRSGHIINALHIAFDDLEDKAEKILKPHKDKFIVTYDDTGMQGAKASAKLRELSYKAVSLKGGLAAWIRDSMPVEKGK